MVSTSDKQQVKAELNCQEQQKQASKNTVATANSNVDTRSSMIETSFGPIRVEERGNLNTKTNVIFCLHGDGKRSSWHCWEPCMNPLAASIPDVRIIAADMPGFGESPGKGFAFRNTPCELIHELVFEKLQVKELLLLVGRSVGGKSALMFAHRFPRLVKHLVLTHPVLPPIECLGVNKRVLLTWAVDDPLGHLYAGPHGANFLKKNLKQCTLLSWYEKDFKFDWRQFYATVFVESVLKFLSSAQ